MSEPQKFTLEQLVEMARNSAETAIIASAKQDGVLFEVAYANLTAAIYIARHQEWVEIH